MHLCLSVTDSRSTLWCWRNVHQPRQLQAGITVPAISKATDLGVSLSTISFLHHIATSEPRVTNEILQPVAFHAQPQIRIHLSCWVWRLQWRISPTHLLQWFQGSVAITTGSVTNLWVTTIDATSFHFLGITSKASWTCSLHLCWLWEAYGHPMSAPTRLTTSASANSQLLLLQLVCLPGDQRLQTLELRCSGTKQLIRKYFRCELHPCHIDLITMACIFVLQNREEIRLSRMRVKCTTHSAWSAWFCA